MTPAPRAVVACKKLLRRDGACWRRSKPVPHRGRDLIRVVNLDRYDCPPHGLVSPFLDVAVVLSLWPSRDNACGSSSFPALRGGKTSQSRKLRRSICFHLRQLLGTLRLVRQ